VCGDPGEAPKLQADFEALHTSFKTLASDACTYTLTDQYVKVKIVYRKALKLIHPRHWLMYEVHDKLKDLSKDLSIAVAAESSNDDDSRDSKWDEYVESHAMHSERLLEWVKY